MLELKTRPTRSALTELVSVGLTGVGTRIAAALLSIITTPLIIASIGREGYGAYSLALSLAATYSIAEQSLAAGVRTLAARRANGDRKWLETEILGTGLRASVKVVVFVDIVLVMILTFAISPSHRFGLYGILSYVLTFSLAVPLGVYARYLEGQGRVTVVQLAYLGSAIATALSTLALSVLEAPTILWMMALGIAGLPGGLYLMLRLRCDGISYASRRVGLSRELRNEVWASSFPMVIISMMLTISYAIDPWIIQHFLGLQAAGDYGLHNRIAQVALFGFTATYPVLWKQRVDAEAGPPRQQRLTRTSGLFGLSALFVTALVGIASLFLIPYLSAHRITPNAELTLGFCVLNTLIAFQLPLSARLSTPAGLRFQVRTTSLMAGINLVMSLVLTPIVGISGPVWSSALALLTCHLVPMAVHARHKSTLGSIA